MRRRGGGDGEALPEKVCPTCGRAFAWRKKWARDWDAVRHCSARCRRLRGRVEDGEAIEGAIARLLSDRRAESSVCPSEVARALDDVGWRGWMPRVRAVAAQLARDGRVRVTQGDREVDALEATGPIRLRRGPRFAPSGSLS